MPEVETVRGIARSKLGAISRLLTGECGMLAGLLADDEPILAMALAQVRGGPWGTAAGSSSRPRCASCSWARR